MKNNKLFVISCSIVLVILIIAGAILLGIFIMEQSDKEQTQMKLEQALRQEKTRQKNLENCIQTAKDSRSNLWDANCTKQSNGSCTIPNNSKTVDWIEQRYQQDLDSCYELYGN